MADAAVYFWDLAFDFNTALDTDYRTPLQSGFVLAQTKTTSAEVVTPMSGIIQNSELYFNLFDITAKPSPSPFTISNVTIQFKNESGSGSLTPFSAGQITCGDGTLATVSSAAGVATIWIGPHVQVQESFSTYFSPSTKLSSWFVAGPIKLDVTGHFLLSVAVTVTSQANVTKTFIMDPEMIVGSDG